MILRVHALKDMVSSSSQCHGKLYLRYYISPSAFLYIYVKKEM